MTLSSRLLLLFLLPTFLIHAQNHSSSKVLFIGDFNPKLTVYGSDSSSIMDHSKAIKKKELLNSKKAVWLFVNNHDPINITVLHQDEIQNVYVRNPFKEQECTDLTKKHPVYTDKSLWVVNSYPKRASVEHKIRMRMLEPVNEVPNRTLLGFVSGKKVFSVDKNVVFDPIFSTRNNIKEAVFQSVGTERNLVDDFRELSPVEKSGMYAFEAVRIQPIITSYSFIINKNKKTRFAYGTGSLCVTWRLYYTQTDYTEYKINVVQSAESFNPYQLFIAALKENTKILLHNESWVEEVIKQDSILKNKLKDEKLSINLNNQDDSNKLIIKDCMKSVATVETGEGFGSGFLISQEGYLLTNYHVIEQASDTIKVILHKDSSTYVGKLIRYNTEYDIALLKIDLHNTVTPLYLAGSEEVAEGDNVITIGTPAAIELGQSVSKGIISGKRIIEDKKYIQTDLNISPGNSGGPLLNDRGEVIGMIAMKITGRGMEGLGFAIPAEVLIEKMNIQYTH